jgi:hypothetical protein
MAPKKIPIVPSKDHSQCRSAIPGWQASGNDRYPSPARRSTGSFWSSASSTKTVDVPGRHSPSLIAGSVTAKVTRKALVDKYAPRQKTFSGYTSRGAHFMDTSLDQTSLITGPAKVNFGAPMLAKPRKHITSSANGIVSASRIPAPV